MRYIFYHSLFLYSLALPTISWSASPPEVLADNPQKKPIMTTREKPAPEENIYGKSSTRKLPWMEYTSATGPSLLADFLYWYTNQGGQDFAANTYNAQHVIHGETASASGTWDPGMRWTFGYNLPYDGWEVQSSWTFLFVKSNASLKPDLSRGNLVAPLWDIYNPNEGATKATSEWRLNYNVLNIDLGRSFFISDFFSLKPFFGTEFAFIYQHIDATYLGLRNLTAAGRRLDTEFRSQQHFLGGGGSMGFSSEWYFAKYWNIYVRGSASLVWARSQVKQSEKLLETNGFESYILRLTSVRSPVRTHLQYAMGLMYHYYNKQTKFHMGFGAGWEFSDWINFSEFRKYFPISSPGRSYIDGDGDLQSSGLTLRLRFDF